MSSKNYKKRGYNLDFESTNHLILIACFTSYEKVG